MSARSGIMLALLAAGQSSRFGELNKLGALLGDRMLGLHAAATGAAIGFSEKLVIASPDHPCTAGWNELGYRIVTNEDPAQGQASSVRLAAACAVESGAGGLCIMLADMPFVTRKHINKLTAAFEQSEGTVASARNGQAMPPAIFPASKLRALLTLGGDSGARKFLADARLVVGDVQAMMDVDTVEDLARANILCLNIK